MARAIHDAATVPVYVQSSDEIMLGSGGELCSMHPSSVRPAIDNNFLEIPLTNHELSIAI